MKKNVSISLLIGLIFSTFTHSLPANNENQQKKTNPVTLTTKEILRLLFPEQASHIQSKKIWIPNKQDRDKGGFPEPSDRDWSYFWKKLEVSPFATHLIEHSGIVKAYTLLKIVPQGDFSCHACNPFLGGAIFQYHHIKNEWTLLHQNRFMGVIGSWGDIAQPQWQKIGVHKMGFLIPDEYMGHGWHSLGISLIAEVDKQMKVIWTEQTVESNDGTIGEHFRWESTFNFIPNSGEFYNIKVTRKGTKKDSKGAILSADEVRDFRFNGKEYIQY